MWHDNETDVDLLGFDYLIDALRAVLTEQRLLPVTVGVFGDWGSGKSSLMRIASHELQEGRVAHIHFSAWQFEGYEDVKAALMQVILQRLGEETELSQDAATLRDKLFKRVDWFYALGLAASRIATLTPPTLEELRKAVRPDGEGGEDETQAIQEFRSDFGDLLDKIEIDALVVFIDDLDRCLPTTIIETFEALRLFLAVPKTAFVIAADERIIRYAIRSRYPAEPEVDLGRDYLEKIVQVPLRIPPLTAAEVETYLNLLFAEISLAVDVYQELCAKAGEARSADPLGVACNYGIAKVVIDPVPEALQNNFELVGRIAPILAAGLNGNPRQLKRFMNALVLRQRFAKTRGVQLDAAVLAKLMILEYLHELQFRTLFAWQAASHGQSPELASAEQAIAGKSDPELAEAIPFVTEPELRRWLELEPPLAEVDLQPYFYFSRDRIEMTAPGRRLSRELQELLSQLSSESDAYRAQALKSATELPEAELRALYEALTDRYSRLPTAIQIVEGIIDIASTRSELVPLLISTLEALPPVSVDPRIPPRLALKISSGEGRPLLESWARQGEAIQLAKSAIATLKRVEKA